VRKVNILALFEFVLQDLAMIFHALNISLGLHVRMLLCSGGVDVSIGEDIGRHID
jgi:hypothetical protein